MNPLKNILIAFFIFSISSTQAQQSMIGVFESSNDVGNPQNQGQTTYRSEDQSYLLSGSGTNMWGTKDELHLTYKEIQGDFILRARVSFIGEGVDPHRKIGWSIRSTLQGDDQHVSAEVHGDGLTSLQFRKSPGGITEQLVSTDSFPDVVQLERKGSTYIMSTAKFGKEFTTVTLPDFKLPNQVFVGIFICSHNAEVIEKAIFSNVRIIKPAPADLVQYRDYLSSNLEIMDIKTGKRKIVKQYHGSLQAPNWTTNGKTLIYNQEGALYNFDIQSQQSNLLYTGFANRNNNDHVLTFDGATIGISHHSESDDGQSIIYYLPTTIREWLPTEALYHWLFVQTL